MSEKIQKVLARAGYGSRREIEQKIKDGLVSVNGKIAIIGDRVDESEGVDIKISGKPVTIRAKEDTICRVLLYHKPEGEICSHSDPEGRKTVFDRLPQIQQGKWLSVGRLDINTLGLLLFTNDGELANALMHPSFNVDREYSVRVFGEVTDAMIDNLKKGVVLEDGERYSFKSISQKIGTGMNNWYNVILNEGKNREVRKLWESQGVQVSRLIRIRYGVMRLPRDLPRGAWVELPLNQVNLIRESVGLSREAFSLVEQSKKGSKRHLSLKTGKIRKAVRKKT